MSNVVPWGHPTKLDLDPDKLLEKAVGELTEVVIIGFRKDGSEYFAASHADGGGVVWHLERAKYRLMKITDDLA